MIFSAIVFFSSLVSFLRDPLLLLAVKADSLIDHIELDDPILLGISDNPQRIFALLNFFDLLF